MSAPRRPLPVRDGPRPRSSSGRAAQRAMLALAACLVGAALLAAPGAAAEATPSSSILAPGPVTSLVVGHDLSCQIRHTDGDTALHQVYPDNGNRPADCGTFLAVDATDPATRAKAPLYTPSFADHCADCPSGAAPWFTQAERFTPVSQSSFAGRIITVATAGTTRIQQTDAYTAGDDHVRTIIKVTNNDGAAHDYRVWRALDCFLGGDGTGYGNKTDQDVACLRNVVTPSAGRSIRMASNTTGAKSIEGDYQDVWSYIRLRNPFEGHCRCLERLDNGLGMSWDFRLGPGESMEIFVKVTLYAPAPSNKPPTAAITYDNSRITCQDTAVHFTAVYGDPDGMVVRVDWDLGDGTVSTERILNHSYAASKVYNVTLTVTDDKGGTAVATAKVSAVADHNCCPTMHPIPDLVAGEGGFFRFAAPVTDYENDALDIRAQTVAGTLSYDGLPRSSGGVPYFDPATGYVFWRTGLGDQGVYKVTFTVTDRQSHAPPCTQVTQTTTLTVLPRQGTGPLLDTDGDGRADILDNCPAIPNQDQKDANRDGVGDACEDATLASRPPVLAPRQAVIHDLDGDRLNDTADNCPGIPNVPQEDLDKDTFGDLCDADIDGDNIVQTGPADAIIDNCPRIANPTQIDTDNDGLGDACESDGQPTVTGAPKGRNDIDVPTTIAFVLVAFGLGALVLYGIARATGRKFR